jgi:hypothetical protein
MKLSGAEEKGLCTTELLKSACRKIIRSTFLFCVVKKQFQELPKQSETFTE